MKVKEYRERFNSEEKRTAYRASYNAQLEEWVSGRPKHNTEFDECCPDFSCCRWDSLWPIKKRLEFKRADQRGREKMLLGSLGSLIKGEGHEVVNEDEIEAATGEKL